MPKQKKRQSLLPQNLAATIKKQRLLKKLTQSQLAERVGIETESISRLERGSALPSLLKLEEIADSLGVGMADLLTSSSTLPQDQARQLGALMTRLDEQERGFIVDMFRRQCEFFISARSATRKTPTELK